MRRVRKILLWIIGLLAVVAAVMAGVFYLTPSEVLTKYLAAEIRDSTGRELVIEGKIERRLLPTLGFSAGPVSLSNADWAEPGPLIAARSLSADIAIGPLLSGRIEIVALRLEGASARIEIDQDGKANYALSRAGDPGGGGMIGSGNFQLSVADARIIDGAFTFLDQRSGQRADVTEVDARLSLPAYDQPLALEGRAVVNGRSAILIGEFDNIAALGRGEEIRSDFAFEADGAKINFKGRVLPNGPEGLPLAEGELALQLDQDRELTAWLRQALPPELRALGAVDVKGKLAAQPEALDLDLAGYVDFNGDRVDLIAKAKASQGWMDGGTVADLDTSLKSALFDVGYLGKVGLTPAGGAFAQGAYRVKAPDGRRLARWLRAAVAEGRTQGLREDVRLERIDLAGDIAFLEDSAQATFGGAVDYNDRQVQVTAEVKGGRDWRAGGDVYTYVALESDELANAIWNGNLVFRETGPSVDGDLTVTATDLDQLRRWVGDERRGRDYGAFILQGHLLADTARARLDSALVRIGDVETAAVVEAEFRDPRPFLRAQISGGPFDLTPFVSPDPAAPAAPAGAWSDAPIDLSALTLADGEAEVRIEGFRVGNLEVGETALDATLNDGRLLAKLTEMGLYGGSVAGDASVDASGSTPLLTADLNATGVRIELLLDGLNQEVLTLGATNMDLKIESVGSNLRGVMGAMEGRGSAGIDHGTLLAVDFERESIVTPLAILGARQKEPGRTPFDALKADFFIAGGVARNSNMTMTGPVLSVKGEGEVDLGQRKIDYVVTPTGFGESSVIDRLVGSAYPIRITGPWSKLEIGVDQRRNAVVVRRVVRDR